MTRGMANFCFLIVLCVFGMQSMFSQTFGEARLLTDNLGTFRLSVIADVTGDGFNDVVAVSSQQLVYFKNIDGTGSFETVTVSALSSQSFGLDVADLDADGDMDILATLFDDGDLVWYKNIDGQGTFGPALPIYEGIQSFTGPKEINVTDVNGDGNLDVVLTTIEPSLLWFANDGMGDFSDENLISTTGLNGQSIVSEDFDGDGDIDVVSSASGASAINFFENLDGQGNFSGPHVISSGGLAVNKLAAADLDGDGDQDIIAPVSAEDKLAWHENLDGMANFSDQIIISTEPQQPFAIFAADVDMDGDIDILVASATDDTVSWFANIDGQGSFGPRQIIDSAIKSPRSVYAGDLNNDGDMDISVVSIGVNQAPDKVVWYENLTILGVQEFEEQTINIYPNPAGDILYLEGVEPPFKLRIYDTRGKLLQTGKDTNDISVVSLHAGLYFLEVNKLGKKVRKKFVKK